MRINLILITICIMTSLTSCAQNHKPPTENEEEKNVTGNEILLNDNVLNEKWYNNRGLDNTDKIIESSKQRGLELLDGTDCFFYRDSTFKIRLWRYGMSSAHTFEDFGEGTYLYHSETKEITLVFSEKYMPNKRVAMPYYIMKGLSERGRPYWQEVKDIYPKSCLKIIQEMDNNRILVELYAYKKNGEKVSFGQQMFIRKSLEKKEDASR